MSDEKRLGVNPLSWVDANAPAENSITGGNGAATEAEPEPMGADKDSETRADSPISAPATVNQEELMGKGKVKIKQTMDTAQAASILEDLAESLSKGVIRAENGEDSVTLCAGETVYFEMKVSRKKDKAKCSIELEWEDDGSNAAGFKISG